MVSMTIRDLPDDTRDRLALRAVRAGQSLQEYMRTMLIENARRPSTNEWLDEVRAEMQRSSFPISTDEIVQMIREDRSKH